MDSFCLRLENCVEVSQLIKEANDVIECREFFLTNLTAVTLPRRILTKQDGVDSRPTYNREKLSWKLDYYDF
jgi:aspartokinase-like uncharacterized kinase